MPTQSFIHLFISNIFWYNLSLYSVIIFLSFSWIFCVNLWINWKDTFFSKLSTSSGVLYVLQNSVITLILFIISIRIGFISFISVLGLRILSQGFFKIFKNLCVSEVMYFCSNILSFKSLNPFKFSLEALVLLRVLTISVNSLFSNWSLIAAKLLFLLSK